MPTYSLAHVCRIFPVTLVSRSHLLAQVLALAALNAVKLACMAKQENISVRKEYLVPTVAILVAAGVALALHHTPRHQVLAAVRDPVAGDMLIIQQCSCSA